MITPQQVLKTPHSKLAEKALLEIEAEMDKRLPQHWAAGLPHCFVIVEDYPRYVLDELPKLVQKYRNAGWDARLESHFIIYFKEK